MESLFRLSLAEYIEASLDTTKPDVYEALKILYRELDIKKEGCESDVDLYGLFCSHIHEISPKKANAALIASKAKVESKNDENESLEEKFLRYVELLESRGYFQNTEKDSKEHGDLLRNAREKFFSRHNIKNEPNSKVIADAEKHKNLGNEYHLKKEYQKAISSYSEAIKLNGRSPIYFSNCAAAYINLGQYQKALEDCNKAIEIDPKFSKAYLRMAFIFHKSGNIPAEMRILTEGLEACPGDEALRSKLEELKLNTEQDNGLQMPVPQNMESMEGMFEMMNNPEFLNSAMKMMQNNPYMQQMAQSLMSNPEMMEKMMGGLQQMPEQMMSMFGGNTEGSVGSANGISSDLNAAHDNPSTTKQPSMEE
jgi:small glutamine-rich tetratricopeptide repeat-containing protein alpha